jgi:hypothetical protein
LSECVNNFIKLKKIGLDFSIPSTKTFQIVGIQDEGMKVFLSSLANIKTLETISINLS